MGIFGNGSDIGKVKAVADSAERGGLNRILILQHPLKLHYGNWAETQPGFF